MEFIDIELEFKNVSKKVNFVYFNSFTVSIIGPPHFNCLIIKQSDILNVRYNKLSKTLTIQGDFSNSVNSSDLKNKIESINNFTFDIDGEHNLCYKLFNDHGITSDKINTHIIKI